MDSRSDEQKELNFNKIGICNNNNTTEFHCIVVEGSTIQTPSDL